jgi:hypothetical protein
MYGVFHARSGAGERRIPDPSMECLLAVFPYDFSLTLVATDGTPFDNPSTIAFPLTSLWRISPIGTYVHFNAGSWFKGRRALNISKGHTVWHK